MKNASKQNGYHLDKQFTSIQILNNIVMIDILVCLYIELIKCHTSVAVYLNLIPDILNLYALAFFLRKLAKGDLKLAKRKSGIMALLFLVWVGATYILSPDVVVQCYQRYRYILFGFMAFHIVSHYMTKYYWNQLLKILYISQIVNTVLVLYQFGVMRVGQDRANGIFGFIEYNNAAQGLYLVIMSIIGFEYYIKGKTKKRYCISMILMACICSAFAEIKAYYVIFALGAIILLLFNRKDKKSFKRILELMIVGTVGIAAAIIILLQTMPENLYAFLGIANWKAYESWETGRAGGMGRTTQISWIYENVYDGSLLEALVGNGPGINTEVAAYELGKLFLNFGFIGLGLFLLFLVSKAAELFRWRKEVPESMISMTMCILTIPVMVIWNATLNRMALLLFVFLSLGGASCFRDKRNFDKLL